MKISVIIPVYNEEKLIVSCLNSKLKQNYPKKDYEIIIVNDGSNDKTKESVQKIVNKNRDTRIKLINQKNKGRASNYKR